MFDAEVAERLKHNSDFTEFCKALDDDAESLKESIVLLERDTIEPADMALSKIIRLQERVLTIRRVIAKPDLVINEAKGDAREPK
jgi:hypothetical protein